MHPALAIVITLAGGAVAFWLLLALVDWLQKGKKKNFPALDPAVEDPEERSSSFHGVDSTDADHH